MSLRLGERKQPGEEPVSSTALLLAVMQGEWRQQRRVVSPQRGDSEGTTAETHQFLKGRAVQPSALSQDTTGVLSAWDGACSGVLHRAGGVEEVRMHLGAETTGHLLHCSTQENPLILFDESSRNIWIERRLFSNLCVTHFPLAFLVRQKISSGVNKPPA